MKFTAWSPDIRHHTKRNYKPQPRLPEEHAETPKALVATSPQAPVVDGRRARRAVCATKGRGALDVRQAARPAPPRGMWRARWWCPCRPATSWATPTPTPPLDRVTLAAKQPDPAWTQQVPPGPDGRQRHLSAVWDMVLESRGVQGTFRISFPCPIVVKGGGQPACGAGAGGYFCLPTCEWALAGAHRGVAYRGGGDGDHGWGFGLNVLTGWEQRRPEWADVAWLAMRVHMGRQRKMGLPDVIDVEEDEPPTRTRKGRPEGDTPPPPKAPRTATPAERVQAVRAEQAEPVGGRGQRGVVQELVDQQREGAWEPRVISAEAANRDLEARLSRANEDRRDSESRVADVTKERDRLATKVKTLERDVATLHKAKPAAQPAEVVERAEGAEAPPGDKGGASAAGVRYLMAIAQAWHAQAEACAGQMSAVSTGLRMAMLGSGQQVDVDSVAPDAPKVTAAMEEVRRPYPPHRHTSAAMDPSFVEAVGEQSSQGSASRSSAPGGGGCVPHPFPCNHHECYPAPPSPKHGQFDQHVGHSPPTVRNFRQHCLYIIWGTLCP